MIHYFITLFLVIAMPIALYADEAKQPASTPLEMSVMIFNEWGLQDAPKMVEYAAKHGHQRVNFVITIHCQLDKNLKVLNYGLIRAKKGWHYQPFDAELLALFQQSLKKAFARAAELKLDIAILPHVDAAGPQYGWRNEFDLDPVKACGGYSYRQVMIEPIAKALSQSINNQTQLEFALTGEMGQTVFTYPNAYRKMMVDLRKRFKKLKTGVSLNFNKVAGKHQPTTAQTKAVQKLLEESDFLGFSCYGPVEVPPKPENFAATVTAFVVEMKLHGITIPKKLELHFSEVGIGGGDSAKLPEGKVLSPAIAASSPWAGTDKLKKNPWEAAEMQMFRRDYYKALLSFLKDQDQERKITAAFMWNTGSWCPYGSDNKAFADAEIVRMIRQHNVKQVTVTEGKSLPKNQLGN